MLIIWDYFGSFAKYLGIFYFCHTTTFLSRFQNPSAAGEPVSVMHRLLELCAHSRHQSPRDQLLHGLLGQLAKALTVLAANTAPPISLALRAVEDCLRQAPPQLAVAGLEVDAALRALRRPILRYR